MKQKIKILTILAILSSFLATDGIALAQSGGRTLDDPIRPPVEPLNRNQILDSSILGSELQLSPPSPSNGDRYKPNIAYNSVDHEYLIVWHNTWGGPFRDIYARRVSISGEVLSWFCVITGAGGDQKNRFQPVVAFNSQRREYLVVYMLESSPNVYEIWGKIIPWNGPGTNAEFLIISWPNRSFWTPRVAYNTAANEYLVAWNAYNTTSGFPPGVPSDIGGNIVEYDGYVQTGSPFSWTSADSPHQVDLAYNTSRNEYIMAYVTVHSSATTKNDIDVIHVNPSGGLVNPPGIVHIAQNAEDENRPAIATDNQNRFVVAWEIEKGSSNHDVWAVPFDWATNTPYVIYAVQRAVDETNPDISYNSSRDLMLVWQEDLSGTGYAVIGWYIASSKNVSVDIANYVFWENEAPNIASGSSNFLIAYEGDSSITERHIFGRLWSPYGLYIPLIRK